ncbi:MAG: universal stress protein [Rubrivivax sp.]|nr:universal stress protein [Rubrivivax sp.]
MKKVLVAIDGSAFALRAVENLIAMRALLADPDALEVHLVHVEPQLNSDITRFVAAEELADYRHEQAGKAFGAARDLLAAAGVPCTCHEAVGHVAEAVTQLAERLGCDQITMGSHGRGALADLLMGSTTLKVIHLAKVPVLLVK